MEKSSIGIDENVAGALAYGLGWVTGIAFLLAERDSQFVRFHAVQSTITFGALCIAWMISLAIPFLGLIIAFWILPFVSIVLWLLLMFKAYRGEHYKLPIVGEIAEQKI